MRWTPDQTEKKYLELVVSMSVDCIQSNGTEDKVTYLNNLMTVIQMMGGKAVSKKKEKP